jgi:hypothetical protein
MEKTGDEKNNQANMERGRYKHHASTVYTRWEQYRIWPNANVHCVVNVGMALSHWFFFLSHLRQMEHPRAFAFLEWK